MATASEIAGLINELPDEEKPKMIALLQNDQGDVIKAARSKIASAAKREGGAKLPQIERERDEALQAKADLEAEIAELKKAAPDLAAKETQWKEKLAAKERELKAKIDELGGTLQKTRRDVHLGKFTRMLVEEHLVDPDYATEVLASKYADRFRFADDGTPDVFKPGEESAYDAANMDEKIGLLAADVKKTVKPGFIRAAGDQGGGRKTGAVGNIGGTNTDPVKQFQSARDQRPSPLRPAAPAAAATGPAKLV